MWGNQCKQGNQANVSTSIDNALKTKAAILGLGHYVWWFVIKIRLRILLKEGTDNIWLITDVGLMRIK